MSRAFVKEDDGQNEPQPQRPPRQHPYYVTPAGLEALRERLTRAREGGNEREIDDLQERVDAAVAVDPAERADDAVHFGALVTVRDPQKREFSYRIVGEDEADPAHGTISWLSPLAQALMERGPGDRVIWERPAGNVPLHVVAVKYE
ncbi:MAG TPA: GreA/GreB family elongation factor [Candidatus Baltobacteraceae bacterium]|nr:GreA/GreB family elongation factor [Candidatus Baltobacteraceae bacterium]